MRGRVKFAFELFYDQEFMSSVGWRYINTQRGLTMLYFDLGDTVDQLRKSVAEFATEDIKALAALIDKNDQFPRDLWLIMGDIGLLGIAVDIKYGGAGMGYLEHVVALEEISRASPSVGLSYGAHSNLFVNQISHFGTHKQKRQYLPALLSGVNVGALAMSEVSAGSDVVAMQLQAEKREG